MWFNFSGEDNWIAISVESDSQWDALKKVMGEPEWANEDKFGDVIARWHNQDDLDSHINQWTMDFEHHDLMNTLIEAGVPSGAVLNPKEVLSDPSMKETSIFEKLEFPAETGMGTRVFLGRPWSMSETPSYIRRPGPDLGGDNEYVLGDILGRTEAEIARLYDLGGIGKEPEPMDKPGTIQDFSREVEQGTLRSYDTEYKKLLGIGP